MINKILKNYYTTKYFLALLVIFFLMLLFINSTYSFIGRGDYANYSNVARNLAQGKGFTVDYIAFHFIEYPELTHPEDMWPLLQPVWMALSFLIFGVTPFTARIPNAFFLVLLMGITYFIGRKIFAAPTAFWGALMTGLNIHLLRYSTEWVTSDVALAVLTMLIAYIGYRAILEAHTRQVSLKKIFWLGVLSGLAILQKPMGVLLPIIYFLFILYFYRRHLGLFTRPGLLFIGSTLLVSGAFFIRNWLLFGTFLLPIEHYLGYLIKYFPYEKIFSIYYGQPPTLQLWLDYGWLNFLKVNFSYFRYAIDTFIFKDLLMPYPVIVLSLVGLVFIKDKRRFFFYPLVVLFVVMSLLMATYWHYESRYYAMLIPVFNLVAVFCLVHFFPKIRFRESLVIAVLALIVFLPSVKALLEGVKPKPMDRSLVAYNWIRDNTPQDSVIMTLATWEMNFHSQRKTLVIPNEDRELIWWMAKKYQATYLELEFLKEIKRPALVKQYQGDGDSDLSLVYKDPGNVYIYKINWDQIKLDDKTKPGWY